MLQDENQFSMYWLDSLNLLYKDNKYIQMQFVVEPRNWKMDISFYQGLKRARKHKVISFIKDFAHMLLFSGLQSYEASNGEDSFFEMACIFGTFFAFVSLCVSLYKISKVYRRQKIRRVVEFTQHAVLNQPININNNPGLSNFPDYVSVRIYYAPLFLPISDPDLTLEVQQKCSSIIKWRIITFEESRCPFIIKIFVLILTIVVSTSVTDFISIILCVLLFICSLVDIVKFIVEKWQKNKSNFGQPIQEFLGRPNNQIVPASVYQTQVYLSKQEMADGTESCSVCLDDFKNINNPVTRIPCPGHHLIHKICISEWIKKSRTCPICRYNLSPYYRVT